MFLNSNSKFLQPDLDIQHTNIADEGYLSQLSPYMLDGSFGVDRIRITFLMDPNSVTQPIFLSNIWGSRSSKVRGTVKLPGQPDIYMHWPDNGDQFMTLEFNPSNFSRIDQFEICPPVLLLHYVEMVIREVLLLGEPGSRPIFMSHQPHDVLGPWPSNWTSLIKVHGLHLARDLNISDPRFSLEQLRQTKPQRMSCVTLYVNAKDGDIETVTHPASKTTARHMIYNKSKERKKAIASKKRNKAVFLPVPDGTYRYKVQMPARSLKDRHIFTLDALTPERLEKMVLNFWAASNYSTPLVWEGQIPSDLSVKLSDLESAQVIQYLSNIRLGVTMNYSKDEIAKIEEVIAQLGLSGKKNKNTVPASYGNLDFAAGELLSDPP